MWFLRNLQIRLVNLVYQEYQAHRDLLDLLVNLVCLLFLTQLVVLLDLWALSVVLRDAHLGNQDLLGLLDHRDLPGLPVVLGNLVFLTDRK
jgi:hypothetical protein